MFCSQSYTWKDKEGKKHYLPSVGYLLRVMRDLRWLKTVDSYGEFFSCGKCLPCKENYVALRKEFFSQFKKSTMSCENFVCQCEKKDRECTYDCPQICVCEKRQVRFSLFLFKFCLYFF